MSFELNAPATVERLHALRRHGALDERAHRRALELTLHSPAPLQWRAFVSRAALVLGAGLVLSAVVYFFAFNWHLLHRAVKFAVLEGGLAGAALASLKLKGLPRQVALTFAAVLLGPLLAVYGQVYQTGADPWMLFAVWALLALPFAAGARWTPLWVLLVAVANVALWQWWDDFVWREGEWEVLAHAALTGVAWAAFETLGARLEGAKGRWAPRVLAAATVVPSVALGSLWLADAHHWFSFDAGLSAFAAALLACGVMVALYRKVRPDLFMLSLAALVLLAFGTTAVGRLLFDHLERFETSWLLMSALLVAEVAFAVVCLKKARRAFAHEVAP